ncbi:MAG: T9SS type A sorting domain-containing protein [Bacteroidales bacterium]|jgi:hypothetical protein|nr:T9SS type A sorting domain-containing protein [Bacteroidales bacterium]
MKKIISISIALAIFTSLIAQQKVNNAKLQIVPLNMEHYKCYTGFEQKTNLISTSKFNKMTPSDQFYRAIGVTRYNLTTNNNSRNTIGFKPKSTEGGAAVWMMGINAATRGTGINYYNVNSNSWDFMPDIINGRIETVATGWGTHAFTKEGEIVVAHNGATGLTVNTRDIYEQGDWQQYTLTGPQYVLENNPTTSLLWPTMATHGNTVHVVCTTGQWTNLTSYPPNYEPNPDVFPHGYLGFTTLPLYYRSTDGGKTWEEPRDFREYGMTNFECFRTTGDGYLLAVRGNHVVLLYNDPIGFVNYLESKDGGDTWIKKTVYDFGLEFAQSQTAEPRLVPTTSSVFIDEAHKVHVVFGTHCRFKDAGSLFFFNNLPSGMIYWNDEKPPIDWHDLKAWDDGTNINYNWEDYPGYITLPSVLGFDKFYVWEEGPSYDQYQFRNHGWTIYPSIIEKDGRIYVSYQSPLDYPFSYYKTSTFYRGVFITVSEDDGETWDVKNNTSWVSYGEDLVFAYWSNYSGPMYDSQDEPYWEGQIELLMLSENAYPSMSYNYKGNLFMLHWLYDYFPFETDGFQPDEEIVFAFTQDLRNIPAYKNIQEVYKGWWNNDDTPIDFPPTSCEKPLELEGSYDGNDIILIWEEPDYIPVPLLGYNIFRDGNKLNASLITEHNYIDENIDIGIYHYQISAVYQNCESNLTNKITIYAFKFCEKPVNLSGEVEEYDAMITWSEPENIDGNLLGYNIYRNELLISESDAAITEFRDEGLAVGLYVYKVSAKYEHCEESELTDGVSLEILYIPVLCDKPENPAVIKDENDYHIAIITWDVPENIDGILMGYNVYREYKLNENLITEQEYRDTVYLVGNGAVYYSISAVYKHCESEQTEQIKFVVNDINNYSESLYKIYPNPTAGIVTITGNGLIRVEICDIQGRKLAEYSNIIEALQINVNKYENGVYLLKLFAESGQIVFKRIVIIK